MDKSVIETPSRPWNWLFIAFALVALVSLLPSIVAAQTTEELAEARQMVIEAERAAKSGDTARARSHYQDAFDLSGQAELIYRVAELDEERENPARAIRHYRLYLELEEDSPYRPRIEARIAKLEESLDAVQSWIVVESVPGAAPVYVEDSGRVRCKTPCRVAVDPGETKLTVRRQDFVTQSRMVFAAAGEEKTEVFDLEPAEAEAKPAFAVLDVEEKVPERSESESESEQIFEVQQSQIDYVRSGPPTIWSLVGWTSLLAGFWSTILLVSPVLPDSTTTLGIVSAAGIGLGGYLLYIHPWSARQLPKKSAEGGLAVGVRFDF